MDKKFICYCGLYCENCAVKAKIEPAAKILQNEMKKSGFAEIINKIPGGDGFWLFLKYMAEDGLCISCKDGGGNPACAVRICAKEKEIEICALCGSYPCEKFSSFFKGYPVLKKDNALLIDEGMDAWEKLQDERKSKGFTYNSDSKL
ncbi:MAG: DUF3795 domain-containing protein [Deferribacteraceae bacterium]|jgi:hypothetical protein|nr:DUF3795 domain-containing protein [Deferribacteraceae bacterium]